MELFVTPPQAAEGFSLSADDDEFIDYYFMNGASVDKSVGLFREASGAAPLFPAWVYGFWQCKEHYASSEELLTAANNFRERRLPLDAVVQDWLYWGDLGWGPVWDPTNYPDPAGLVDELHSIDLHFMVI